MSEFHLSTHCQVCRCQLNDGDIVVKTYTVRKFGGKEPYFLVGHTQWVFGFAHLDCPGAEEIVPDKSPDVEHPQPDGRRVAARYVQPRWGSLAAIEYVHEHMREYDESET